MSSHLQESAHSGAPAFTPAADRRAASLVAFITVVALVRIVATHGVFSQTLDEAHHIATGLEWLDLGTYRLSVGHPPLGPVAEALGPFLEGIPAVESLADQNRILHGGASYRRTLSRARFGVLPFFVLTIAWTWYWTRCLFGPWTALWACALMSSLPPMLAHAGLATTDMPLTAMLLGAVFASDLWLEKPTVRRSVLLGLALGLALLSKFSAYLFVTVCVLALVAVRRWLGRRSEAPFRRRRQLAMLALAGSLASLTVWAGYRFSTGAVLGAEERPHLLVDRVLEPGTRLHDLAYAAAEAPCYPAPTHFMGLRRLFGHASRGHRAFLLGEISQTGWWYYFPVALLVKTPLAFLVLCAIGLAALAHRVRSTREWSLTAPAACAAALLLSVLPSSINIGVRHILPIYPMLSILAGIGAVRLWRSSVRPALSRSLLALLTVWQLSGSAGAHPDYLAWFNELARNHPEEILVDSNLDWGQDVLRLATELERRQIAEVSLALFARVDLEQFGLPAYRSLAPNERAAGWIAASISLIKLHDGFAWLEGHEPVARVGSSILLYHLDEADTAESPRGE